MSISVIIPTLNEEKYLEDTLKSVDKKTNVIVVDGGSYDSTIVIARRFTDKIILSERGRGMQMERGAREASASGGGDILLFLHADTLLPRDWRNRVEEIMKDSSFIGGGFKLKINSQRLAFRFIEAAVNLRSKYLGLIYGDQAIFVRKDAFFAVGGFMGLPLMEDVDLIRRLKKKGKMALLDAEVHTSSRKWDRAGVLRTTLRNWIFLILYYMGISPERLYRRYYA